jgi:hypothetical protein
MVTIISSIYHSTGLRSLVFNTRLHDDPSPRCTVPRHSSESADVRLTPSLDVVQPLPTRSFSVCVSIHDSKHRPLHQPIVLHPADMIKQTEFPLHDELYNVP